MAKHNNADLTQLVIELGDKAFWALIAEAVEERRLGLEIQADAAVEPATERRLYARARIAEHIENQANKLWASIPA